MAPLAYEEWCWNCDFHSFTFYNFHPHEYSFLISYTKTNDNDERVGLVLGSLLGLQKGIGPSPTTIVLVSHKAVLTPYHTSY